MRIAINATPLLSPLTGIGHYTYQLVKGMQAIEGVFPELFYASHWSRALREKPVQNIVHAKKAIKRFVPCAYRLSRGVQQFHFSKGSRSKAFSLYHEPNFLPFKFKGPTVVTAHDLSWIHFPEMHPADRVKIMHRYFEKGLNQADFILTDALSIRREIIDMFNISPERIRAIPLGVDAIFYPRNQDATRAVLKQYDLTHGEYILSVGTLEPRKNLQATLRAFMKLPRALRKRMPLVLIGMKGWHTTAIEKEMTPLIRSGEIRQLGYVSREALAVLTAGALTLVFPSIYEGFGLPPLEAMTSAVPVITSNVSSLPEVVGDGGVLIAPENVDGLSAAMEQMILSPEKRAMLSKKAFVQSEKFSWARCMKETLAVYREVYTRYH